MYKQRRITCEIAKMAEAIEILVLYHSRHGAVEKLARLAARGVESTGARARLRCVAALDASNSSAAPLASMEDLRECHGLLVGSPTRFGNMSAAMQAFFEATTPLWLSGALSGKPAAAFTATATQHGGNESTLLDILRPLLHHGMLLVGLPYTESALSATTSGGTPYGASHVSGASGGAPISAEARSLAMALGARVAHTAMVLARGKAQ
jgi:NAD(P)H dehydrogenase (quinone)